MLCHGNGPDHCCWIDGVVCPFLEEDTVPDRRWACGLYRELGSWERVHADPRYLASDVHAMMQKRWPGRDCGDWPLAMPDVMDNPAMGKCCYG